MADFDLFPFNSPNSTTTKPVADILDFDVFTSQNSTPQAPKAHISNGFDFGDISPTPSRMQGVSESSMDLFDLTPVSSTTKPTPMTSALDLDLRAQTGPKQMHSSVIQHSTPKPQYNSPFLEEAFSTPVSQRKEAQKSDKTTSEPSFGLEFGGIFPHQQTPGSEGNQIKPSSSTFTPNFSAHFQSESKTPFFEATPSSKAKIATPQIFSDFSLGSADDNPSTQTEDLFGGFGMVDDLAFSPQKEIHPLSDNFIASKPSPEVEDAFLEYSVEPLEDTAPLFKPQFESFDEKKNDPVQNMNLDAIHPQRSTPDIPPFVVDFSAFPNPSSIKSVPSMRPKLATDKSSSTSSLFPSKETNEPKPFNVDFGNIALPQKPKEEKIEFPVFDYVVTPRKSDLGSRMEPSPFDFAATQSSTPPKPFDSDIFDLNPIQIQSPSESKPSSNNSFDHQNTTTPIMEHNDSQSSTSSPFSQDSTFPTFDVDIEVKAPNVQSFTADFDQKKEFHDFQPSFEQLPFKEEAVITPLEQESAIGDEIESHPDERNPLKLDSDTKEPSNSQHSLDLFVSEEKETPEILDQVHSQTEIDSAPQEQESLSTLSTDLEGVQLPTFDPVESVTTEISDLKFDVSFGEFGKGAPEPNVHPQNTENAEIPEFGFEEEQISPEVPLEFPSFTSVSPFEQEQPNEVNSGPLFPHPEPSTDIAIEETTSTEPIEIQTEIEPNFQTAEFGIDTNAFTFDTAFRSNTHEETNEPPLQEFQSGTTAEPIFFDATIEQQKLQGSESLFSFTAQVQNPAFEQKESEEFATFSTNNDSFNFFVQEQENEKPQFRGFENFGELPPRQEQPSESEGEVMTTSKEDQFGPFKASMKIKVRATKHLPVIPQLNLFRERNVLPEITASLSSLQTHSMPLNYRPFVPPTYDVQSLIQPFHEFQNAIQTVYPHHKK